MELLLLVGSDAQWYVLLHCPSSAPSEYHCPETLVSTCTLENVAHKPTMLCRCDTTRWLRITNRLWVTNKFTLSCTYHTAAKTPCARLHSTSLLAVILLGSLVLCSCSRRGYTWCTERGLGWQSLTSIHQVSHASRAHDFFPAIPLTTDLCIEITNY